jgi:hypothetical protein
MAGQQRLWVRRASQRIELRQTVGMNFNFVS